jgi:hypothetical protein
VTLRFKSESDIPRHLLPQQEANLVGAIGRKRAKYNNRSTVIDDKRFDSQLEARCYQWLTLRWKAGNILWFTRQVPFELPGGVRYRADFLVATKHGVEVWDAKGYDTQESRNKRKQVEAIYGVHVQLWNDRA